MPETTTLPFGATAIPPFPMAPTSVSSSLPPSKVENSSVAPLGENFATNVSVNALAISKDGDAAYAISTPANGAGTASLYKFGTASPVKTLTGLTANAGIPAGGYNAATNDYWFATVDNTSGAFRFYRVDLDSAATTVSFASPTATFTAPGLAGASSIGTDLTFDGQGRMYLVISTNTSAYTKQMVTFSPAQLAAGGTVTGSWMVDLDAGVAATTFPGVAFGSSGYLYTQGGTTLYQSNPTNGAQVSTKTTPVAFSDLGSCANPTIVNAVRSTPFIILMVAIIPFTRLVVGTSIGTAAAIVPLTIAATPFIARLVEASLREVDHGLIEAVQAMGASPLQIVRKVLLPEALPGIVAGLTITLVSLTGFSAMAGFVGGGGLGDLGIRYGYQRFQGDVMAAVVIILILLVQGVQSAGDVLARRLNKRIIDREESKAR